MSEQEAFEEWAKSVGLESTRLTPHPKVKGAYRDDYVDDLWDGWKARAEYAATPAVQTTCDRDALTEKMIEAGAEFLYGHPRSKAVEWAKEDKFDSCAAQAKEIFTVMSANYWRGL